MQIIKKNENNFCDDNKPADKMGIKIKSFTISNLPAVSYNLFVYHYFNTETV